MKSLLGRRHGTEKREKDGKDREEGGEDGSPIPAKKEEAGPDTEVELEPNLDPEQGSVPERLSSPSMEK